MNDAVIHFAQVSSNSLEKVCRRAIEGLKDKNLQIKRSPELESAEALPTQLRDTLSGADLSVHLLDDEPGYSQPQIELARELGIPQLIWISDEFEEDDFEGDYATFLQTLEKGSRDGADYEFVRASRRVVAERILERVERLQREKSAANNAAPEIDVLIDSHLNDFALASNLVKLFDDNNIRFSINIPQGGPLENISLFETMLQQSKKLLLVYGNVEENWVRERLAHVTQLMITRGYRLDCNVYAAPPLKDQLSDWLDARFAKIIDNSASHEPNPAIIINALLDGDGATAVGETSSTQDDAGPTPGQRRRLQQKIAEQEKIFERLSELLQKLNEEKIYETRSNEKLRLEQTIAKVETERAEVEQRLSELEQQL